MAASVSRRRGAFAIGSFCVIRSLISGLRVGAEIIDRRVAAPEIAILKNDKPGTGSEWSAELDTV